MRRTRTNDRPSYNFNGLCSRCISVFGDRLGERKWLISDDIVRPLLTHLARSEGLLPGTEPPVRIDRGCVKTRATQLSAQQFTRIQRLNTTQRKAWSRSQLQAVETCAGFSQGRVFTQPRSFLPVGLGPETRHSGACHSRPANGEKPEQIQGPLPTLCRRRS